MRAQTSLFEEITVDNFAGGGGASTGIELATIRPVDIAINHDPDAVAMHKTNHPHTRHYCESVWQIDPIEACGGRPVALAWFSPDCKHFSKAKGGKPVNKNIRGLAWIVLRWAALVRPRVIMLENVEEFQTWGPVRKGKPIPERMGETFRRWKSQLEALGYQVDHRELRACDYGAPTIRKRLFVVARCDGRPIVWPEPTHGDPNSEEVRSGKLQAWRTAAEIIDWSLPCPSIFDSTEEIMEKYGVRAIRPLAEATMRRIARGIQKYVIENPAPFIVQVNHGGHNFRGQGIREAMPTITAKHGYGVVAPTLIQYHGEQGAGEVRGQSLERPLLTVDGANRYGMVTAFLSKYFSGGYTGAGSGMGQPAPTVTCWDHNAVVAANLVKFQQNNTGGDPAEPLHTVMPGAQRFGVVSSHLLKMKGDNTGQAPGAPLQTVTAGGNHYGVVASNMVILRNNTDGKPTDAPLNTITASPAHFAEVRAFLIKYYGQGGGQGVTEPLHTATAQDRFGVVTIQGTDYAIVDIGLRMLTPRELFAANGFPPDYVIDRDYTGKAYPKSKQVARCGNAVPPQFAEALVRANLPELCGQKITTMAELENKVAI